jgi:hypothetical protein
MLPRQLPACHDGRTVYFDKIQMFERLCQQGKNTWWAGQPSIVSVTSMMMAISGDPHISLYN